VPVPVALTLKVLPPPSLIAASCGGVAMAMLSGEVVVDPAGDQGNAIRIDFIGADGRHAGEAAGGTDALEEDGVRTCHRARSRRFSGSVPELLAKPLTNPVLLKVK